MKTNIIIILIGILLLSSCKSNNEVIESFTPFTLCDPAEARLLLIVDCSFRGVDQRPFVFNFPEEISQYKVPPGRLIEEFVSPICYYDFDPPTGRGEGLISANLSNVVVFISIFDPATTNRVKQEIQIPWLVTSAATNNDFWYRATWKRKEPNQAAQGTARKLATPGH